MQTPANSFTSPAPAPQKAASKGPTITYEDVVRIAQARVLSDFTMQQAYHKKRADLLRTGGNVDVVATSSLDTDSSATATLVRPSTNRLIKEHSSSSWSLWFFQWSLFGGFAVTSVTAVMSGYLGFCHNRMFFPFAPFCGVLAYRTWNMLEATWEQQRYADNAAQLRNKRLGNPMHSVARIAPLDGEQEPKTDST